jgi:phosphoglycerate dehydrogenase-like enzyme
VSLHTPFVPSTYHLIDAHRLALMPPTALLVNTSRGEVVDEEPLAGGALAGAALNVFHQEPLPPDHPLTTLENVLLTPHVAGTVIEARIRIMKQTAANVRRVMTGEFPVAVVNGVRPAAPNPPA